MLSLLEILLEYFVRILLANQAKLSYAETEAFEIDQLTQVKCARFELVPSIFSAHID